MCTAFTFPLSFTLSFTIPLSARRRLADIFNELVRQRLAKECKLHTDNVLPSLRKDKMISSSGISTRLAYLRGKRKGVKFTVADADLPTYRAKKQAALRKGSTPGGSRSALPPHKKKVGKSEVAALGRQTN